MKAMIKYLTMVIILVELLQACKVTRDYVRPTLDIPASFRITDTVADNGTSEIPPYQEFFADVRLVKLLDRVMIKNPDIQIASENLLATERIVA